MAVRVCMVLFPFLKKCSLRDGGANLYSGAEELNRFQHSRYVSAGVHNAKAEECTTPRIGSRNIEINIGGGGLPIGIKNSNLCCYSCRVPAVLSASPSL